MTCHRMEYTVQQRRLRISRPFCWLRQSILEKEIAQLEAEKKDIEAALSSGELAFDKMEPMTHRIGEIIQLLDDKGMRWLELSEIGS